MPRTRLLIRWLPTFLAFPLAGLVTVSTVGSLGSPLSGALAGLLAGAVVGGGQWLALRGLGVGLAWWLATALAASLGTFASVLLTDAGTSTAQLAVRGLATGAAIGVGQALAVRRRPLSVLSWAVVTSAAWGIGWIVTSRVIVDAERGYVTFGASGALLATLLTGLALPLVLDRTAPTTTIADEDSTTVTTGAEVAR